MYCLSPFLFLFNQKPLQLELRSIYYLVKQQQWEWPNLHSIRNVAQATTYCVNLKLKCWFKTIVNIRKFKMHVFLSFFVARFSILSNFTELFKNFFYEREFVFYRLSGHLVLVVFMSIWLKFIERKWENWQTRIFCWLLIFVIFWLGGSLFIL